MTTIFVLPTSAPWLDEAKAHSGYPSGFFVSYQPVERQHGYPSSTVLDPYLDWVPGSTSGTARWDNRFTNCAESWGMGWLVESDMYVDVRGINADGQYIGGWYNLIGMGPATWVCPDGNHYESFVDGSVVPPDSPHLALRYRGQSGTVYALAKTTAQFEPLTAPTNLRVTGETGSTVLLAWDDTSAYETGFELERSEDRLTWELAAAPEANQTSYEDLGLVTGRSYWYRVRAVNYNQSAWSDEVEAIPGCPSDTDCDGLNNSDESDILLTDPRKPDTDGDGLLDPWEAPNEVDVQGGIEAIENAGFTSITVPSLDQAAVSRDQVFGPYIGEKCEGTDSNLRFTSNVRCFNQPPDPLHRDVFLEIDWQDCANEGCPGPAHSDPMHHAPDLQGLAMVVDMLSTAPISNPDGVAGINLRILVDESIDHVPNCDQDSSALRADRFGTEIQRGVAAIMRAKALAVRYGWSGHSSREASADLCPNPGNGEIFGTSMGWKGLEPYDWSPFGDANVSGRDILITLGPVWSCNSQVGPVGVLGVAADADCDRPGSHGVGIYPTSVVDHNGEEKNLRHPMARMLGVPEPQGIAQLWARTLAHLLGHSLGISSEAQVRNAPDEPAPDLDGDGRPEDVLRPEPFLLSAAEWLDLQFAPTDDGQATHQEAWPRYDFLASRDSDGDGVPEGSDNCPGLHNPKEPLPIVGAESQPDADRDGQGDACDEDADWDGMTNQVAYLEGTRFQSADEDPMPFDTDNDGLDNWVDPDDDGDGVGDGSDNCVFLSNATQTDADADGGGDACDVDADGNGILDAIQGLTDGSSGA